MPNRKFIKEILAGLHNENTKMIIRNERKRKYEKEASEKIKKMTISKNVLDLIQGSLYYSKKKGELTTILSQKHTEASQEKRKLFETE